MADEVNPHDATPVPAEGTRILPPLTDNPSGAAPRSRTFPEEDARIPIIAAGEPGDDWAGRLIGPYRIVRKLSRGGMGVVLLAIDEALRRQVAVKVMDGSLLTDADALKRFEREARAAAAAQHRNIAQVYLVGLSQEGLPFLALEFVDGQSLLQMIRNRTPLSYAQIATVMEQVASALGAAQRVNIIHRDIKPGNIMIAKDGEAKVVDFGLAKIFHEDSFKTQEGMVLGTPTYMAPEQSQGRVVDHRADIYSFGATFYHAISGRPPFTADSPVQIMMKHVTAPLVPMRNLNPTVPLEFDEIIGRCMRKDVDERYQDYEALLTDIRRLRLQATAREVGPIIGAQGTPLPVGSRSSGSVALPPPPGSSIQPMPLSARPGGGTTATVRMAPVAEDPPAPSPWTPVRIAGIAAGVLVALAIGGSFFLGGAEAPPEIAPPNSGGTVPAQRPALAIWLARVGEMARQEGAASRANPDYAAWKATLDVLDSLRNGLASFQIDNSRLPGNLREITKEDRVILNFDTDPTGNPLDGWRTPLYYDPVKQELRSAGLDRTLETDDDIVQPLEGAAAVPERYERIEPVR